MTALKDISSPSKRDDAEVRKAAMPTEFEGDLVEDDGAGQEIPEDEAEDGSSVTGAVTGCKSRWRQVESQAVA